MFKSAYEMNINKGFYTTYLKREMDRSISQEHWTNNICEEIIWSPFQGILEHAYPHEKGPKKLLHSLLKVLYVFNTALL